MGNVVLVLRFLLSRGFYPAFPILVFTAAWAWTIASTVTFRLPTEAVHSLSGPCPAIACLRCSSSLTFPTCVSHLHPFSAPSTSAPQPSLSHSPHPLPRRPLWHQHPDLVPGSCGLCYCCLLRCALLPAGPLWSVRSPPVSGAFPPRGCSAMFFPCLGCRGSSLCHLHPQLHRLWVNFKFPCPSLPYLPMMS